MRYTSFALAGVVASSAAAACEHVPTPVERAAVTVRDRCAGTDPGEAMRIVSTTRVVRTEPVTFHAGAGTKTESTFSLSGAKLTVLPPEGVSAPAMARALHCHSARSLLGHGEPGAPADDPFYVPDTWVYIRVDESSEREGVFVVSLTASRIYENVEILRRAVAFAQAHPADH